VFAVPVVRVTATRVAAAGWWLVVRRRTIAVGGRCRAGGIPASPSSPDRGLLLRSRSGRAVLLGRDVGVADGRSAPLRRSGHRPHPWRCVRAL